MKFSKESLQDEEYTVIEDKIIEHKRWSVVHRQIFEHEGKYYETTYNVAATESQDERPYEYAPNEVECPEVRKVEKLMNVWERVAPDAKD